MADGNKKTNSKRRSGFWRSYSFVLTLVVLLSFVVVGSSALDISVDSTGVPASSLISSASPGVANFGIGYGQTIAYSYFSNFGTHIIEPFSFSRSGSIISASASGTADFGTTGSGITYSNECIFLGGSTGNSFYDGSVKLNFTFTDPVYSYQFVGSVTVISTLNGSSVTSTYNYNTDTVFSAEPYTSATLSIPVPSVSKEGKISSVSGSVRIDVSKLRVVTNFDLTMAAMVLPSGSYLGGDGALVSGTDVPAYTYLTEGFKGLDADLDNLYTKTTQVNTNLINFKSANHQDLTSGFSTNHQDLLTVTRALVGSGSFNATLWNSSTREEEEITYSNLLSAVSDLGSVMQNDLAKLRYVLASDKDIEMAEKQEPVKDAIADSFTGDSAAAVKDTDVGDMAGFSGNFQDAFSTGANAADALGALTSADSWLFWSQEVANDLNQVGAGEMEMPDIPPLLHSDVAVMALDDADDDFIHFYDPSVIDAYLSGGDKS